MATAHVPQLTNRQVKAALGNDGSRYGIQLSRLQSRMRSEGIQRRLMRWGVLLDSVWVAEALYTENRLHIEPTNPTSKHKCEFTLTGTEEGETSPELLKTAAKKLVQRIDLALFGCSLCGDIPRLEPSDVPSIWRPAPWAMVWRNGRYWAVDKHGVIWGVGGPLPNQAANPDPLPDLDAGSQATDETPAVQAGGGPQDDADAQHIPTTLPAPAGPTGVQPTTVDAVLPGQASPTVGGGLGALGVAQAGDLSAGVPVSSAGPLATEGLGDPVETNIADGPTGLVPGFAGLAHQGPAATSFDAIGLFDLQVPGLDQINSNFASASPQTSLFADVLMSSAGPLESLGDPVETNIADGPTGLMPGFAGLAQQGPAATSFDAMDLFDLYLQGHDQMTFAPSAFHIG